MQLTVHWEQFHLFQCPSNVITKACLKKRKCKTRSLKNNLFRYYSSNDIIFRTDKAPLVQSITASLFWTHILLTSQTGKNVLAVHMSAKERLGLLKTGQLKRVPPCPYHLYCQLYSNFRLSITRAEMGQGVGFPSPKLSWQLLNSKQKNSPFKKKSSFLS